MLNRFTLPLTAGFLAALTACSNGGGSSGSGGNSGNTHASISVSREKLNVNALEGQDFQYVSTVRGSIINPGNRNYTTVINLQNAPMVFYVEEGSVDPSTNSMDFEITYLPASNFEPGSYFGTINVLLCEGASCSAQTAVDTQDIQIVYTVTPTTPQTNTCVDQPGVIFEDCTDPSWIGPYGWEYDNNTNAFYHYFSNNGSLLVDWNIIDEPGNGQNKIIDVRYNDNNARGQLNFAPVNLLGLQESYDLSSFADGYLEFDVKLLNRGANTPAVEFAVECGWPCGTGRIALDLNNTNEWYQFRYPVSDLVPSGPGLDLTNVEVGFIIAAEESTLAGGLHFQLDNIRWVGGEEQTPGEEENTLQVATNTRAITMAINDTRDFAWVIEVDVPGASQDDVNYVIEGLAPHFVETTSEEFTGVGASARLVVDPVSPLSLGGGTFRETIFVRACLDTNCTQEYANSPQEVELIYSITPTQNTDPSCEGELGDIFVDCIGPDWLDISTWESRRVGDTNVSYRNFDGTSLTGANWSILDTQEAGYDWVIDIQHSDDPLVTNKLQFLAAGFSNETTTATHDFSAYSNGTLAFDIKVLDWGQSAGYIEASVECIYPCASTPMQLDIPQINVWTNIRLSVPELIDAGLSVAELNNGLVIGPPNFENAGLRYQIDNIRWIQ